MNNFDVKTVELAGANIIEASAGTGKTFSIAVLVVRLILENEIPVSKMLLVTFTEAAAAELKERSIKFIRLAIEEIEVPGSSKNSVISEIVNDFTGNKAEAKERLYTSLLNIDKAMMCTIHSFCQRTLNEFAFETNQAFGKELLENINDVIFKYIQKFKREILNSLEFELFEFLNISDDILKIHIDSSFQGKYYYNFKSGYRLPNELIHSLVEQEESYQFILSEIESNIDFYKEKVLNKDLAGFKEGKKAKLIALITDAESTLNMFLTKSTDFVPIVFEDEVLKYKTLINDINLNKQAIRDEFYSFAIDWHVERIQRELIEKNYFTFDDLINQLHKSRNKAEFQSLIRSKYDVVFLDEFQDTDQKQYDIFYNLFQEDSKKIIFYIGDPKQSIYSWRKADLNTYYDARNSIDENKRFDMKRNFRSSVQLINALNQFFQPNEDFDTFENGDEVNRINYIEVTSANTDHIGLIKEGIEFSPIRVINNHSNNDEINESIEVTLKYLFFGGFELNNKKIRPSNVCVLTRTNWQSKTVKEILNNLSIPSVISDDAKVIDTVEAKELLFVLDAILLPQKSSIQKALLTLFFNYKINDLKELDFDYYVELFKSYSKIWTNDGVYVALNMLLNDFNIIAKLQEKQISGQRVISNLKQLIELLQEKELRNSFTPNETFLFLQNQINSSSDEEISEYSQRLENDEDTVKIVTIHKSKGMEYDIVIAPFLDFDDSEKYDFSSIRLPRVANQNNYVYVSNPIVDYTLQQKYKLQQKQENRRLIYVALTRAKYNLFIINKTKNDKHALAGFIKALPTTLNGIQLINRENLEQVEIGVLEKDFGDLKMINEPLPSLTIPDSKFKRMSYSSLAAHPAKSAKEAIAEYEQGSYDQFIFKDLPKGAHVGNLLHDIFEFIDYTDASKWEEIIQMVVVRYLPNQKENSGFLASLYQLIVHALNSTIQFGEESFHLSSLVREKRKNEFEFNFQLKENVSISALENVLEDETRKIQTSYNNVQGMMTGFIDLFFEHDGKFYILDWKSNFLGDNIDHYNKENLLKGMNESNYHLQYLIYALALDKYLFSKLPGFDFEQQFGGVIYLFLRGNRAGEQSGVYTQKVTNEELKRLKDVLKLS